ncbi:hypothetical protein AGLY_010793 [Aphis glycines]|uniref:Uncharacterized protein n=1 Tax=Aphis glycines TaxID=307491 RepID=A0A6G0TGS0_APHGL|nr:hypothetical protein AGLY_010793 [Aphis glycines]
MGPIRRTARSSQEPLLLDQFSSSSSSSEDSFQLSRCQRTLELTKKFLHFQFNHLLTLILVVSVVLQCYGKFALHIINNITICTFDNALKVKRIICLWNQQIRYPYELEFIFRLYAYTNNIDLISVYSEHGFSVYTISMNTKTTTFNLIYTEPVSYQSRTITRSAQCKFVIEQSTTMSACRLSVVFCVQKCQFFFSFNRDKQTKMVGESVRLCSIEGIDWATVIDIPCLGQDFIDSAVPFFIREKMNELFKWPKRGVPIHSQSYDINKILLTRET